MVLRTAQNGCLYLAPLVKTHAKHNILLFYARGWTLEDAVNFAGQGRNGVFCDLFPGEYTAESGFLLNSYLPSAVMLNQNNTTFNE